MRRKSFITTISMLLLLSIVIIPKQGHGIKAVNQATKSPKYPHSTPLTDLTTADCQVTLAFIPVSYTGRLCSVPEPASTPGMFPAATSLNDNLKYYCKVTVEPNTDLTGFAPATYTAVFQGTNTVATVKVPKEVVSKVTVVFYERCNNCTDNKSGRPTFRYTGTLGRAQTFFTAQMTYLSTAKC